jgi:hypothetical protein
MEKIISLDHSWNLNDSQIINCMKTITLDKSSSQVYDDNLRLFLYAKGIMQNKESATRKAEFDSLLNNPKNDGAKQRLLRIVDFGEENADFSPGAETIFEKFVKDHPVWASNCSFVVFRDHPKLRLKPHAYIERFQLSGLCYMHAPVVLQHYLVAMTNDKPPYA